MAAAHVVVTAVETAVATAIANSLANSLLKNHARKGVVFVFGREMCAMPRGLTKFLIFVMIRRLIYALCVA